MTESAPNTARDAAAPYTRLGEELAESAGAQHSFRPSGPVSAKLESELRTHVRRHGLVVWLDPQDHYGEFVRELAVAKGQLPYQVHGYQGSYLELMCALEDLTGGVEPRRLVVHLAGLNEESVKSTPIYELYRAGYTHRKALATLVTEAAAGKVRAEEIADFTSSSALTLSAADAWLSASLEHQQGGVAAQLRALSGPALIDDLLKGGFIAKRLDVADTEESVWAHLATAFALPAAWRADDLTQRHEDGPRPGDIAFTLASWVLSVEYVFDLKRQVKSPRLLGVDKLPKAVRDVCCDLAAHLRRAHAEFYRRTADETETLLHEESTAADAQDLGRIDTFRFEEVALLEAAGRALGARDWALAAEYADIRMGTHADARRARSSSSSKSKSKSKSATRAASYWVRWDPARQSAWQLVSAGATLGRSVAAAGPRLAAASHSQALARYTEQGALVDQAHRQLEQLRLRLLSPQVPEFDLLRECLDDLRAVWRTWADAWAADFAALCVREGFLPPSELQQRNLFEEVVRPSAEQGTTAFFIVDALRYEMAEALRAAMDDNDKATFTLSARFAELPTTSGVGMNVLAPVAKNGRLYPSIRDGKFTGFSAREFQVRDPATRRRAMHARVGGTTCPGLTLSDVLERDTSNLKRTVAQANLLVIDSKEIDSAGHKGVGPAAFDTVLQRLRSAWRLLRQAGVRRFVFTADHGFLLLDGFKTVQAQGTRWAGKYRYALSELAADRPDQVRVTLGDLGYDRHPGPDKHLIFSTEVSPFDRGGRPTTFAHGGNSLQERVVPVLTVVHRAASGGTTLSYTVNAKALKGVSGMHRLQAQVDVAVQAKSQAGLDFGGESQVELALRVPDLAGVSVELCQARDARIANGAVIVTVGKEFELFFRLSGHTNERAQVLLYSPSRAIDLAEAGPSERFPVSASGPAPEEMSADEANQPGSGEERPAKSNPPAKPASEHPPATESWLDKLPDGVREIFAHIEAHGSCFEGEAAKMLGGSARAMRRFSLKFEKYAAMAPFEVRIYAEGGVKRYVRGGA